MAKSKNNTDFDVFKSELESSDGVRVFDAAELDDPEPNFTGSYSLDYDLVVPFPEGKIVEVFGSEGSCKTTLMLEVIGQALAVGKRCLYVNMEKNLTASLLRSIRSLRPFLNDDGSVKNGTNFWIVDPSTGEQAFEAMRKFAAMHPNSIAVLDSIDAAQPESVLSGQVGDQHMGKLARLLSDGLRKLIDVANRNKVTLAFVNQVREKMNPYGDPEETPGGRAMKFYASQRIKLLKPGKAQQITNDEGDLVGVVIRYKIVKNKCAPDGQDGSFPILYNNGIYREQELISKCLSLGILSFGGRGGRQVLMPVIDRKTGEQELDDAGEPKTIAIKQALAGKRLLIDRCLSNKLSSELKELLSNTKRSTASDAMFEDEVSDS